MPPFNALFSAPAPLPGLNNRVIPHHLLRSEVAAWGFHGNTEAARCSSGGGVTRFSLARTDRAIIEGGTAGSASAGFCEGCYPPGSDKIWGVTISWVNMPVTAG